MDSSRLEIPLNRKKFLLRGGLFTALALAGVWLLLSYAPVQTFLTPWVVQVIAGVLVFVFGILAMNDLQKGMGNPIGLVITPEGIIDHSSNLGVGLIRWKEIRQLRIDTSRSNKHILVEVAKPKDLQKKARNPLQQNLMNTNLKLYGTPIVIQTDYLTIPTTELLQLLEERLHPPRKRS
ncbi:MAG: DUF4175 domain-containing protein [Saprospiraceae bacterium]|nr:DUF4175 domain-containing protein [Saprospiraceae bacterium]